VIFRLAEHAAPRRMNVERLIFFFVEGRPAWIQVTEHAQRRAGYRMNVEAPYFLRSDRP
jgi:hypothetical protein